MSAVYRNLDDGANFAPPPRLLDRMRQVLRTKHYAYSTEQAYAGGPDNFVVWVLQAQEEYRCMGQPLVAAQPRHISTSLQTSGDHCW